MVRYQNSAYIFGGSDGKNKFNDLWRINLDTLKSKQIIGEGDIPRQRFGHTADVYNGSMYVFGGWDGLNTLDELYQFSFGNWLSLYIENRLLSFSF
jgi:hypothetical protein